MAEDFSTPYLALLRTHPGYIALRDSLEMQFQETQRALLAKDWESGREDFYYLKALRKVLNIMKDRVEDVALPPGAEELLG